MRDGGSNFDYDLAIVGAVAARSLPAETAAE
jgi:hypothetical protein